jgi:hypothetical protein
MGEEGLDAGMQVEEFAWPSRVGCFRGVMLEAVHPG